MAVIVLLLLLDFALTTALSWLNLAYLKRRAASPLPPEWAALLDTSRFPQMVAYREANTWLSQGARLTDLAVTLAILLSGLLPALARWAAALPAARVVQGLAILAVLGGISYLAGLPWGLLSDFGVERKFGFSTITFRTWLMDQVKSLFLAVVLGVPLAGVLLLLIERMGATWWLPAWGVVTLFQLLVAYIAPVVILPLFNKFEPLQDEALREDIFALARKAGFPLGGVFQINASLRSTHSNAYFTGFGKNRRIALFDTLLETTLSPPDSGRPGPRNRALEEATHPERDGGGHSALRPGAGGGGLGAGPPLAVPGGGDGGPVPRGGAGRAGGGGGAISLRRRRFAAGVAAGAGR
jgi:STE24 endopeptidase